MSSSVGSWSNVPCTNPAAAPSARAGHSCVSYKGSLYVFGGYDGGCRLNDLHKFDFASKRWTIEPAVGNPPTPRSRHSSVVHKDKMYVFGGYDGHYGLGDLMEYNFATHQWSRVWVVGDRPAPRYYHSAVVYKNSMYCFGGEQTDNFIDDWDSEDDGIFDFFDSTDEDGDPTQTLYAFNFETSTWTHIRTMGSVPSYRYNSSLVVFNNSCILFGGYDDEDHYNDVHAFDFASCRWNVLTTEGPAPHPRAGHIAEMHSGAMYIFGGAFYDGDCNAMNDLYKLTIESPSRGKWEVVTTYGPPMREHSDHAAAVYDSQLIIFGGYDGGEYFGDLIQCRLGGAGNRLGSANSSITNDVRVAELVGNVSRLQIEPNLPSTRKTSSQGSKATEAKSSPTAGRRDSLLVQLCSCPISMDIMTDPVVTPSGITYERAMIEMHLERLGPFDPTSKAPLTKGELYPNRAIKELIQKNFPSHG